MKRLVMLLAACGSSTKPAPVANTTPASPSPPRPKVDCGAVIDNMIKLQAPDFKMTPEMRSDFVQQCEKEYAKDPDNPVYTCMATAKDGAAADVCMRAADTREAKKKPERGHGPRKTEAELMLNKLGKSAKVYFITYAAYMKGTAKQLPAPSCCGQPNNMCPVTTDWATDPVWRELDFSVDEPNKFQYSYTSDGKTFHAEAVGDLDCDGIAITYKLDGDTANGNPQYTLTAPPPSSD